MDGKRKILFVCRRLNIAGGKERVLVNTASFLAASFKVGILQLTQADSFYPVGAGVDMFHIEASNAFGKRSIAAKLKGFVQDIKILRRFMQDHPADMVISVDYFVSWMLVLGTFFSKRPYMLTGWEHIGYNNPWVQGLGRKLKNYILKQLDHLVVLTQHDADIYNKMGIPVTTIPNAKSFESIVKSNLEQKRILTIGRLSPQKGIDYLLDLIVLLKDSLHEWRFVLVAQDDLFSVDELKKWIAEKQIGHLIDLYPPTSKIVDYYLQSSMYLMTSRNEGLPMVLIEAMECGLPCVSFDCETGPADIIQDGVNGKLVPTFDLERMAESVLLLTDDVTRKMMGVNAAASVEKFSLEKISKQWQEFLNATKKKKEC